MTNHVDLLMSRYGYNEYEAKLTNEDLNQMDADSIAVFEAFIAEDTMLDYGYRDFTVKMLQDEYGLNPIAAILSISMLKRDYDEYAKILKYHK